MAHQAPLSMGFSAKLEYWNGLPCLPPGDLPDPGTETSSCIGKWVPYHKHHLESPDIKKQRHHFADKDPYSQSYVFFSSSHVHIGDLDHKEDWKLKNWCFRTVVQEKTLKSPLDQKEIKPVHPKGIQPWIFFRRTDAVAEALILWPPDWKSWLIRKDPDAGKGWRQKEKGAAEDEMVR